MRLTQLQSGHLLYAGVMGDESVGDSAPTIGRSHLALIDPRTGALVETRRLDVGWDRRAQGRPWQPLLARDVGEFPDNGGWIYVLGDWSTMTTLDGGVRGKARGLRWQAGRVVAGPGHLYCGDIDESRGPLFRALDSMCRVEWEIPIEQKHHVYWSMYVVEAVSPSTAVGHVGGDTVGIDLAARSVIWRAGLQEREGLRRCVLAGDMLVCELNNPSSGTTAGVGVLDPQSGRILGRVALPAEGTAGISELIVHQGAVYLNWSEGLSGPSSVIKLSGRRRGRSR